VAKGVLDLGKLDDEADKKAQEQEATEHKDFVERIKKALGDRVKEVRVTLRLTESPACLVADEHDMTANLQRMLKAAGQKVPLSQPILEINTRHPLVLRLQAEADESRFGDLAAVLFDQSLLAEGGQLEDPAGFVKRLNQLMMAMGK
jgi:molecular chaperone HtpG